MPKLGIVISNYNGWRDTLACLESLRAQTWQDFTVLLLDDGSTDDSVKRLQGTAGGQVVFWPQRENRGFAAVNNLGIRRLLDEGADWVMLLNNDTLCAPDMLETLLAQTPPGAVSCPKMLFMDPPDEVWFAGGALDRQTGRVIHMGGHAKDGPAFSRKKRVGFITFCCVLLPRSVIEQVGYLDEDLFMYCEDVDYCLRLLDAGIPMWYLPDAVLRHRAGGSTGGMLSMYYITRNTLMLRCRGKGRVYRRLVGAMALLGAGPRFLAAWALGHRRGRSCGIWRGSLDFWRGRTGRMEWP